jgi:serine/threonine-protein kinase RsbW
MAFDFFKRSKEAQLQVPAHADYLGDMRDFIARIGHEYGYPEKLVNAFKLTIDEAASNIIRHGYRSDEGSIIIRAIIKKRCLTVSIIDQGLYFDPKDVQNPDLNRYIDDGKRGGLGIFIMRKLMDEMHYRKTKEGNELQMTKYCQPSKKGILAAASSIKQKLKARYL